MTCSIVPPYLLRQIASATDRGLLPPGVERPSEAGSPHPAAGPCRRTLEVDEQFRAARRAVVPARATGGFTIHSADNTADLPGRAAREADDAATGDLSVDEAHDSLAATLQMYAEVYRRQSWDGQNARVDVTVHYERDYDNAFWNGTQLVFGDGDATVFDRFTKPVDVMGHEFTHAVTESVAGLVYQGQSGALNESVSDVFGICLKQRMLDQSAAQGDWVVGEGLFLPRVSGRGLRDMHHPGTAYDDPVLGKDPQGADMSAYVETADDNGGVHLNSGIPNRAFVLAALAIGGTAAEGAGRIWWTALAAVPCEVDFAGFAAATIAAAGDHAAAVADAWAEVGVDVPAGEAPRSEPVGGEAANGEAGGGAGPVGRDSADSQGAFVEVRRSGGFAGRTLSGRCDLLGTSPQVEEVRSLLSRVDLQATKPARVYPDMYTYLIRTHEREVSLVETQLSDDLRRLTALVLSDNM